jgi:penicillin-binding protein 1A
MALPIFAYYMLKIYKDSQLGYTEDEKFDFPEGFDPCENSYDGEDEEETGSQQSLEEIYE